MDSQYNSGAGHPTDFTLKLKHTVVEILNVHNAVDDEPADMVEDSGQGKEINFDVPVEEDVKLSLDGILDEETITRSLSHLGRSADGCYLVYLSVKIPGFSLTDISLLSEYEHLQKVEIPHNDITDLSPLGKLKFLLFLDASHNKIEKLLDFDPPFNLQEVDLSWNCIQQMCDLSAHRFLRKLVLDNNAIQHISGLSRCKMLKHLSLSHNKIAEITGLDDLPIQHLNLSHNIVRRVEHIESLKNLKKLYLPGNCIQSLSYLKNNTTLEIIDLEANEVLDLAEIHYIKHAKNLRELNLLRNPIKELSNYRLSILYILKTLIILDRHPVKPQEKVAAVNLFNPSMEVAAAVDHSMHIVYSFLQPARIWHSTLPNIKTPYPILVLVGPQGAGKKELCKKLVEEFGEYFGQGVSHTTRHPRLEEVAGEDYFFVSQTQFDSEMTRGAFVQTCLYDDSLFGLQMASIDHVAVDGLACIVHMELEGVMGLKKTHFEPRYVLIMPLDREIHEKRLLSKDIYSRNQIEKILKRSDMYIEQNEYHPGFFDMMICSDDINEAYAHLCKLVMDYLGISSRVSVHSTHPKEVDSSAMLQTAIGRVASPQRSATWSKHSYSDSLSQHQSSYADAPSQGLGIVEEESFRRRHSAAEQVVKGYKPPLTEELQTKYLSSTTQIQDNRPINQELTRPAQLSKKDQRSMHHEVDIPNSPDSFSSDESEMENSQRDKDIKVNTNTNFLDVLPKEKVNPLHLIAEQSYLIPMKNGADGIYALSPARPNSSYGITRPGSDKHAVLPPIESYSV